MNSLSRYLFLLCTLIIGLHASAGDDLINQLFGKNNDQQVKVFKKYLKEHPDSLEAKMELLGLFLDLGQEDKAISLVKNADLKTRSDADLPFMLAQYFWMTFQNGPGFSMSGGWQSFSPVPDDFDHENWKKTKLERICGLLDEAIRLNPENEAILILYAHVLANRNDTGALRKHLTNWDHVRSKSGWIAFFRAILHNLEGDKEAAFSSIELALERNRHVPDFHKFISELYTASGDADKASLSKKRAEFYSLISAFLEGVDYDESLYSTLKDLALFYSEEPEPDWKALNALRRETVDKLLLEESQESNLALAALCFSHSAHGELEDAAYKALEERGQSDLLRRILINADSTCTIANAGPALARLRDPTLFDILVYHLPSDQSALFSPKIAYSLSILQDIRAIDPLIEVVRKFDGYARDEALLALGAFSDREEVLKVLNRFRKKKKFRIYAEIALYRHEKDSDRMDRIREAVFEEDFGSHYQVLRYLKLMSDEPAKLLASDIESYLQRARENRS